MIISRFKPDGRSRQGLGRGGQDNVYGYCIYTRVYNVRECPEPLTIFARANFTTAISNTTQHDPYLYAPSHPPHPSGTQNNPFLDPIGGEALLYAKVGWYIGGGVYLYYVPAILLAAV